MTRYPYLDLTVLPEIRELVISARAALIMSTDLSTIFWANGEGTRLLGHDQVRNLLEDGAEIPAVMKRQISSAAERLDGTSIVSGAMRITSGWKSALVGFKVSTITLPDGENGILLVSDPLNVRSRAKMAATTLACLEGQGYVSAVLGHGGTIISASKDFEDIEVGRHILAILVDEVQDEQDRLVKRLISTGNGMMAAGIARLTDDPASHLLILASEEDDAIEDDETETVAARAPVSPETEPEDSPKKKSQSLTAGYFSSRRPSLNKGDGGTGFERWYFRQRPGKQQSEDKQGDPVPGDAGETATSAKPEDSLTPVEPDIAAADIAAGESGETPVVMPDDTAEKESKAPVSASTADEKTIAEASGFRFVSHSRPTRFAWNMDGNYTFTTVSPELGEIVGPLSADITGKTWRDVAERYALDPDGKIQSLLERGDTWSGRSVLWPVQGTDLQVMIELAGLPSFDQDRLFSGFHGFGTIHSADAVIDPQETGLSLGTTIPNEATPDDDEPSSDAAVPHEEIDGHEEQIVQDFDKGGKIVSLTAQREARIRRELSSGEQATFRKIAEKLSDSDAAKALPVEEDEPQAMPGDEAGKDDREEAPLQAENTGPVSLLDDISDDSLSFENASEIVDEDLFNEEKPDETPAISPANIDTGKAVPRSVDTSILANLPIAVLIFRDEELLFSNQEFTALTGYEDTDDLLEMGGIARLLGGTDGAHDGYTHMTHKDGSQIAVDAKLQSVPWNDDAGNANRALLLALRKETEKDAVRPHPLELVHRATGEDAYPLSSFKNITSRELSEILDTATDGVVVLSENGEIRSINRAAEALFGYESLEVKGQDFTHLLATESHRAAKDYLSGLSQEGVASLLNDGREMIGKEAQGGLIPLFVTMRKLEQSDGYCAVLRDITQWKKVEEDLVAARRQAELASNQKTDFLAKISHEIRTPLNAIIGFSEVMLEERFGKISIDRYREYLRDINRSGSHVLELVNDLLDISKIEAGKLELDFAEVKLNDIIAEGVALTQPQANRDHIIIRTSLSGAVPPVVADARSIRQIILNLVSNAIKYTKAGGQVIVSTVYEETGEVVLRVRDTGIGMSENEITTAMMPFRRVQTISSRNGEGTGLGLPLTKALVEANLAQFTIESTPGKGTLVEVYFPSTRVLTE